MKVRIQSLIVEVGRKCTRQCEHCLRGPMEDVTIDLRSVKYLLDQVDSIGLITFTGGEPTLYGKEIAEIVDYIVERDIPVENFYVASNGEIYDEKLMSALLRLYGHCVVYGEAECNCYDVSNDQFHAPRRDVIAKLKAFSFFSQRKEIPAEHIIAEGYGEAIGHRYLSYNTKFYIELYPDYDGEEEVAQFDCVYLNAVGRLVPDCDYSFETQRNMDTVAYDDFTLVELVHNENFAFISE